MHSQDGVSREPEEVERWLSEVLTRREQSRRHAFLTEEVAAGG